MALMCPTTTDADVDLHLDVLDAAVTSLAGRRRWVLMTGVVGDEGAWVVGGRTGATVIAGALVVVEVSSVSRSASAC